MELGSKMYSIESEIALMKSDMILIKSEVTSKKSDMISTNSTLESVPRNVYIFFHNFNGGKVDVLSQSMSAMMICDNKITVPYVLLNDRVFGLMSPTHPVRGSKHHRTGSSHVQIWMFR